MSEPVLIVTGGPGAGKTTVSRILAERSKRSVHLDADRFFRLIVSGVVAPWLPESHEQNTVVMGAVAASAGLYAAGGYFTIVDGIVIPGWFFEPLRDDLRTRGAPVSYVVLRPPLDVAIRRSRERAEDAMGDPEVIRQLWRSFAELGPLERHVLDVREDDDPESVATRVAERFAAGDLAV